MRQGRGDRLTLPGKVDLHGVSRCSWRCDGRRWSVAVDRPARRGRSCRPRSRANLTIVRFLLAATIILLITVPTAFLIIYMEMKIIALMNLRIGPDRVGPFGSVLSVVHGLKVLMKEDFTPDRRGLRSCSPGLRS